MSPAPGDRIDRYILGNRLGQGGMGVVYSAEDTRLGRTVALKFLVPDSSVENSGMRFETEARAAASLNHPNICTVHEISEWEGRSYIAMELVDGQSLEELLKTGGLPFDMVESLAGQIAQGLAAAHEQGVVHRDVKPGNILITKGGLTKIVDFGLAKTTDLSMTRTGSVLGTVAYLSPEQLDGGTADHRSDIWAFGVVLYQMLTGRLPFSGDRAAAVMYAIMTQTPSPPAAVREGVPPVLELIALRCLAKDPKDRYASMNDVLVELGISGVHQKATWALRRRSGRWRVPLAVVGVVALVGLGTSLPGVRGLGSRLLAGSTMPNDRYVAVLPFTAADPGDSPLAASLEAAIVRRLASIDPIQPSFWLVSEPGAEAVATPLEAGTVLGATVAVEGSVDRQGDSVRVSLRLGEGTTGREIRSGRVVGPASDVLALESLVLERLVDLLELQLSPASQRLLARGTGTGPGAPEFYAQGREYLQRWEMPGQTELAISLFEQAIQEDRGFAPAYAGLGEAYLRKYQAEQDTSYARRAEENSNRAAELDSRLVSPHLTLGLVRSETGRYGEALASFEFVLSKEPGNAAAYRGQARAHESLQRFDAAEQALRQAIALRPEHWEGYQALGSYYFRRGEYEQAIEQFTTVTRLTPTNVRGLRNLGGAQFYLKRIDEAIATFERALAIAPDYSIYSNLGTAHYWRQDYARAAAAYRSALDLNDADYRIWDYLATSLHQAGDRAEARRAWRSMIEKAEARLAVNARDLHALAYTALGLQRIGDEGRSAEIAAGIENQAREDRSAAYTLALIHADRGEGEEALRWLDAALAAGIRPDDPDADPWLAELRRTDAYAEVTARYR